MIFSSKNLKSKKEARFILAYNGKTIGILEHKGNKWIFKYSEQYKKEQFVVPLEGGIKQVIGFNLLPIVFLDFLESKSPSYSIPPPKLIFQLLIKITNLRNYRLFLQHEFQI